MDIVTLRCGDYAAQVNLSRGANCISLRNEKHRVRVLREPDYSAGLDNPYLYGMPILFPVNRIAGGRFEFEGREYVFPINEPKTGCHLHGALHETEFTCTAREESYVKCEYRGESWGGNPQPYGVVLEYALSAVGLEVKCRVQNLSCMNMPVFLGYHTTFNVPFVQGGSAENVRVCAEVGTCVERDMSTYLPTGRMLPPDHITRDFNAGEFISDQNKISRHYRAAGAGGIELRDTEARIKIVYENDLKFAWRLFYNGDADEYICLEPQTCMVNCQRESLDRSTTGFDFIPPESEKTYISAIRVEEMQI